MRNKKFVWGMLAISLVFGLTLAGCKSSPPLEGAVKLEYGGTLPKEVLSYLNASQLKDIEAKFLVVQGRTQVSPPSILAMLFVGDKQVVQGTVLITVGKEYRIVQMSQYIQPYTDNKGYRVPGEHRRVNRIDIVPDMATKYNTLQEARLASEI